MLLNFARSSARRWGGGGWSRVTYMDYSGRGTRSLGWFCFTYTFVFVHSFCAAYHKRQVRVYIVLEAFYGRGMYHISGGKKEEISEPPQLPYLAAVAEG